jgi:hypothetical protein
MKYLRKTPIGPAIISKRIAASVWKAFFPRKKNVRILKRLYLRDSAVFCRFAWKLAGMRKPPRYVSSSHINFVKDVTSFREDILSDGTYCVTEVGRVTSQHDADGARVISRGNEFLTEVAVSKCLQSFVNPFLPSPTFCVAQASWTSASSTYGNIAMEFAGETLSDIIDDLTVDELRSVTLQVAVALSWAQKKIHFKHHDLHSQNIYVIRKKVPQTWTTPSGLVVNLPAFNVQARISDFGLSSATDPISLTRHCRIDFDSLNVENRRVWGDWNNELANNEGYDFLFFVNEGLASKKESHTRFFRTILDAFRVLSPGIRVSRKEGRPLTSVPISPEQILSHILTHKREA